MAARRGRTLRSILEEEATQNLLLRDLLLGARLLPSQHCSGRFPPQVGLRLLPPVPPRHHLRGWDSAGAGHRRIEDLIALCLGKLRRKETFLPHAVSLSSNLDHDKGAGALPAYSLCRRLSPGLMQRVVEANELNRRRRECRVSTFVLHHGHTPCFAFVIGECVDHDNIAKDWVPYPIPILGKCTLRKDQPPFIIPLVSKVILKRPHPGCSQVPSKNPGVEEHLRAVWHFAAERLKDILRRPVGEVLLPLSEGGEFAFAFPRRKTQQADSKPTTQRAEAVSEAAHILHWNYLRPVKAKALARWFPPLQQGVEGLTLRMQRCTQLHELHCTEQDTP